MKAYYEFAVTNLPTKGAYQILFADPYWLIGIANTPNRIN